MILKCAKPKLVIAKPSKIAIQVADERHGVVIQRGEGDLSVTFVLKLGLTLPGDLDDNVLLGDDVTTLHRVLVRNPGDFATAVIAEDGHA